MKNIKLLNKDYVVVKDDTDCFDLEVVEHLFTEYFLVFDYILGDYSYGKLRLKGFFANDNKKSSEINKYSGLENYLKEFCAYNCAYFVLKKQK